MHPAADIAKLVLNLLAGLLPVVVACTPDVQTRTRKVLLIGIDGVRPDVLREVDTPNLDQLIANGTFSANARTGYPSVSGPGWSSMLTGVWPEKHGVTSNDFRDNRYDRFPDFLTRIEQVRPALQTFVVADWLPLVAEESGGPLIGGAPDRKIVLDGYDLGWSQADSQVVDAAVDILANENPDAGFVYLGNPDETSHEHGSIGIEYRHAIAEADGHVGRLVRAIRSRRSYDEDWLILVSTDHGRRQDGGHGGDTDEERTIFYLVSGSSATRQRPTAPPGIVDVAVTALVHLEIFIDSAWGLDGRSVGISTRDEGSP